MKSWKATPAVVENGYDVGSIRVTFKKFFLVLGGFKWLDEVSSDRPVVPTRMKRAFFEKYVGPRFEDSADEHRFHQRGHERKAPEDHHVPPRFLLHLADPRGGAFAVQPRGSPAIPSDLLQRP